MQFFLHEQGKLGQERLGDGWRRFDPGMGHVHRQRNRWLDTTHHDAVHQRIRQAVRVHQGHTDALAHERAGRLGRTHLDGRGDRLPQRLEVVEQGFAQRRVAPIAHQHLAGQHRRFDDALARQPVAGGQHANDLALRELAGDQVGVFGRERGNRDVRVSQQQLGQQRIHAQRPVADAHAGVAGAELRRGRRDQPFAEAGAGHPADQTAAMARQASRHIVQPVDARLNGFHFLVKFARFLGGMQAALEPFKQRIAQAQFYRRQHPADGGLRLVQQGRTGRGAAGTHQHVEGQQQVHVQPPQIGQGLRIAHP
ncbi:hypothetical protein G6F65_017774 [Rhizopus arrhizus]|nr:hypothetical protein G6F65_017774 [Rhizopus arrhizus]